MADETGTVDTCACNSALSNEEKVEELGWLDDNGICQFPYEVKAVCLGFISPGLPINFYSQADEKQIQQAVDSGWIKFVDGNGDGYTFAQYVKKYPEYPDPLFQLKLGGRFPPRVQKFLRMGRSRV